MSDDTRELLIETAERIFGDLSTAETINACEQGEWPSTLWQTLDDNGLVTALLPETVGGSGLAQADGVAILRVAGYHAAPAPLAETWLAGLALADAGYPPPAGALTLAPIDAGDLSEIPSAQPRRVPWGGDLPVLGFSGTEDAGRLRLYTGATRTSAGTNLAGEPRAGLNLADARVEIDCAARAGAGHWLARGALFRAAQMAGALRRCLDLACEYSSERQQFGRPLAKFQAIQQQLALLGGEAAAVDAAVDAAANADHDEHGRIAIAVAKARAGMAVETATRIAHQVHGAIGYTHEHRLHHFTRRLWSWRDEFGDEVYWNSWLGRRALAAGGAGLWPWLTALGGA